MTSNNTDYRQSNNTSDDMSEGVDIFTIFLLLWRRKFTILATMLLGLVGAFFLISASTPRYTAVSHILVQSDTANSIPEQLLLAKKISVFDIGSVLTELEVLKSRRLVARVVKRLNLIDDLTMTDDSSHRAKFFDETKNSGYGFRDTSVDGTTLKTLPPEAIDPKVSEAVTNFKEYLSVTSVAGSLAVKIGFTSSNPQKSALIVNTLVDEYITLKFSQKRETQTLVTEWLENRLKTLRTELFEVETEIQEHRALHKIVPDNNQDVISTRQILELNEQYANVQESYNDLQSQLKQLSGQDSGNVLATLNSKIVNTTLIRQLESDKLKLSTRASDLSTRYGPKHPAMIKVKAELEDTNKAIDQEFEKARGILKSELGSAKSRLNDIEKDIDNGGVEEKPQDAEAISRLRELEREAESSRLVLKTFLESYQKSIGKTELQKSEIDVISYANVPTKPSYPNRLLIFVLSLFISTFIGIFLAIVFEKIALMNRLAEERS